MTQEIGRSTSWFREPDWWMVALTFFLFVVGFVTLIVFYRQFGEMQRQTEILNSQAKQAAADSVEANKKVEDQLAIGRQQAKAAQDSVAAIKTQMIAAERPWLGIANIQHDKPDLVFPPSKFVLIATNTGKSPALGATFRLASHLFKTFPQKPPYPELGHKLDTLVVLPGVAVSTDPILKPKFTDTENNALIGGKQTYYVYAIIHYRDPLTKRTHTTKFCSFWVPYVSGYGPDNPTGIMATCPFYNEAD
jgi:hypothetical protein